MKKNKDYTLSSGNVFADLGIANPEEWLAKAELARQINHIIKQKKLNQTEAADLLDIDQPKISMLKTGRLDAFSLERLFRFLNILDQDITIKITPKVRSKRKAFITVNLPKTKKLPIVKEPTARQNALHARKK